MIRILSSRSRSWPSAPPPADSDLPTLVDGMSQPTSSWHALECNPEPGLPRGPLAGGCLQTYSVRPAADPAARPRPTEGGIRGERRTASIIAGKSIFAGGAGTVAGPFGIYQLPVLLSHAVVNHTRVPL